jgi:hypothetical protein
VSHYLFEKRPDSIWRLLWFLVTVVFILMFLVSAVSSLRAYAAEPSAKIDINVTNAGPREVEETTRAAIQREYGSAWQAMTKSLASNYDAGISSSFVGAAKDTLLSQLDQQKHSNLFTRIVDRGHKLDVVFYSPEGSAMQFRDTAQLEKQYLSGSSVVHSESITAQYVVLMSVAEDRWKVRLLQELR